MEKRDISAIHHIGNDLVHRARALSATSTHLPADLAAVLFPKSEVLLSDRILSNGRQYLRSVIAEIESRICLIATEKFSVTHQSIVEIGNNNTTYSYAYLLEAGLLSKANILEHVFTQAQKIELTNRLVQKISQDELDNNLSRFLDHEDKSIAEAAMALLVSKNRSGNHISPISPRLTDLPAEVVHDLVWSVTAAIRKLSRFDGAHLLKAAEYLLAGHDESQSCHCRALRLAGLLHHGGENSLIPHPLKDDLDLFIARMALRSGIKAEQIILYTAEPNMARIIIMMRALAIADTDALSIFTALDGSGNLLTASSYNEISQDEAIRLVGSWSTESSLQAAERALASANLELDD